MLFTVLFLRRLVVYNFGYVCFSFFLFFFSLPLFFSFFCLTQFSNETRDLVSKLCFVNLPLCSGFVFISLFCSALFLFRSQL